MGILKISIVNNSDNPAPSYATAGSAGMDIRANLEIPVLLKPLERALIPTGLFIELPENLRHKYVHAADSLLNKASPA